MLSGEGGAVSFLVSAFFDFRPEALASVCMYVCMYEGIKE